MEIHPSLMDCYPLVNVHMWKPTMKDTTIFQTGFTMRFPRESVNVHHGYGFLLNDSLSCIFLCFTTFLFFSLLSMFQMNTWVGLRESLPESASLSVKYAAFNRSNRGRCTDIRHKSGTTTRLRLPFAIGGIILQTFIYI